MEHPHNLSNHQNEQDEKLSKLYQAKYMHI